MSWYSLRGQAVRIDRIGSLRRGLRPRDVRWTGSSARSDFITGFQAQFDVDRAARFRGEPPMMVPVVDADRSRRPRCQHRARDKWFTETHEARAPRGATK